MRFVEELKARQRQMGLSDARFAELLGIDQSMWNLIRRGRRHPGAKTIRGALKTFPELSYFLAADMTTATDFERQLSKQAVGAQG